MAADAATGRDRFLENESCAAAPARLHPMANWSTSGLKDIAWRGEKYSLEQIARVPAVSSPRRGSPAKTFELATDIKEDEDARTVRAQRLAFPLPARDLSAEHWLYRDYIRQSKGEFTVAKDQYVRLQHRLVQ